MGFMDSMGVMQYITTLYVYLFSASDIYICVLKLKWVWPKNKGVFCILFYKSGTISFQVHNLISSRDVHGTFFVYPVLNLNRCNPD